MENAELAKKGFHGPEPCGGGVCGGQKLLPVRAHGRPAFFLLQGGVQRLRQGFRGRFLCNPAIPAVGDELRQAAVRGNNDGRAVEP